MCGGEGVVLLPRSHMLQMADEPASSEGVEAARVTIRQIEALIGRIQSHVGLGYVPKHKSVEADVAFLEASVALERLHALIGCSGAITVTTAQDIISGWQAVRVPVYTNPPNSRNVVLQILVRALIIIEKHQRPTFWFRAQQLSAACTFVLLCIATPFVFLWGCIALLGSLLRLRVTPIAVSIASAFKRVRPIFSALIDHLAKYLPVYSVAFFLIYTALRKSKVVTTDFLQSKRDTRTQFTTVLATVIATVSTLVGGAPTKADFLRNVSFFKTIAVSVKALDDLIDDGDEDSFVADYMQMPLAQEVKVHKASHTPCTRCKFYQIKACGLCYACEYVDAKHYPCPQCGEQRSLHFCPECDQFVYQFHTTLMNAHHDGKVFDGPIWIRTSEDGITFVPSEPMGSDDEIPLNGPECPAPSRPPPPPPNNNNNNNNNNGGGGSPWDHLPPVPPTNSNDVAVHTIYENVTRFFSNAKNDVMCAALMLTIIGAVFLAIRHNRRKPKRDLLTPLPKQSKAHRQMVYTGYEPDQEFPEPSDQGRYPPPPNPKYYVKNMVRESKHKGSAKRGIRRLRTDLNKDISAAVGKRLHRPSGWMPSGDVKDIQELSTLETYGFDDFEDGLTPGQYLVWYKDEELATLVTIEDEDAEVESEYHEHYAQTGRDYSESQREYVPRERNRKRYESPAPIIPQSEFKVKPVVVNPAVADAIDLVPEALPIELPFKAPPKIPIPSILKKVVTFQPESLGSTNALPAAPKPVSKPCEICCMKGGNGASADLKFALSHTTEAHRTSCKTCMKNDKGCVRFQAWSALPESAPIKRVEANRGKLSKVLQEPRYESAFKELLDRNSKISKYVHEGAGDGNSVPDLTAYQIALYDLDEKFLGNGICISGRIVTMTHFQKPDKYCPWNRWDEWYFLPADYTMTYFDELVVYNVTPTGVKSHKIAAVAPCEDITEGILATITMFNGSTLRVDRSYIGDRVSGTDTFIYSVDTTPGDCGSGVSALVNNAPRLVGLHCFGMPGKKKNAFVGFSNAFIASFRNSGGAKPPDASD
jgi:hypothetical protein